ncbi:tRNA 2-selenouridine(34) synthase MnmH [Sedimentimonas flavescens]|uniref:tRNA 2-selenouridine(34) synthase MnmH n=1 Tax=Sedimentimonas flavescens TaxID=2851012 RepID=UPI0021A88F33|nr:tRNA 2-selenouridine(34) synthase MnmH [Sedimentimonas flavescens]MCT2540311.1 tRNA 2-selenouridine(34) synthase MnmH [Sedimentimonas flavescens]
MQLASLAQVAALDFDSVIDVRSPSEFAEDHIPGAINLPVLDDEERARVGTIYKQVSPFDARKIGAALVAQNAARHLQGPLSGMSGGWRPLVYCWRGGQRSGSFATILRQVGWRAELVEGGYKTWRGLVVEALTQTPVSPFVVLDGNTGSAKTEILLEARRQGAQVLDLEGLANHRGSIFGAMPGGQPAQKGFEGRLAMELAALDPARPVLVEAESSRIGNIMLPKGVWSVLCAAPRLRIAASLPERAGYLARAYADIADDHTGLLALIDKLRPFQSADVIEQWQALARQGAHRELAEGLMALHYDPRYEKHRARHAQAEATLPVESLAPEALEGVAARVIEAVAAISR